MIPKIKKILYATDLSANSAYAFRYAINFAKKHDASIIILHVFEKMPANIKALLGDHLHEEQRKEILEENISYTIDRIRNRLKIFYDTDFRDEPECADRIESIEVCEGYPAEEILRKADELDCDAIIMGTHGKGIIGNAFLGSTSKKVLRRVRKPVFIIPLPKGEIDITFNDI